MKIILTGIVCLFFGLNAAAQTENTDDADSKTANVEQISLLHDDGAGKAGDETENFSVTDKTLHFRIQLSSRKSATVKMVLVAADAAGLKPETKSATVNYKTNGRQNIVNFRISPENQWLAGKYRADVLIDGKLSGGRKFEIQKSGGEQKTGKEIETKKSPPAKTPEKAPPRTNRKKKT